MLLNSRYCVAYSWILVVRRECTTTGNAGRGLSTDGLRGPRRLLQSIRVQGRRWKGKAKGKGNISSMDALDVARSSKLSHSVGAGVKWNALQLCCLDTIWIFQLPVCLFAVNKVLCFIKCVPVIFPPKLTTATVIMLLVKNCAELCTAAFVNKQRTCLKEKVVHLFVLLYIIVILFRRHKSPWKDLSRRHVIKAAVFYFSFFLNHHGAERPSALQSLTESSAT